MPRPGPRPYECVRRAWHSDRHHPIRGSLIKEIFRIVNEVHCSATRKNREWQEKLPIVVLKAEEILYSKANSEAEYSDLQTLWDRVNDAINTIIRRDESTETGQLLQPCIEAALHLGCTPRRSSRSQRNDTPRGYLRPQKLEGDNTKLCANADPLLLHCPQYSSFGPLHSGLKDQKHCFQSRNSIHMLPMNHTPPQTSASSNLWSIYPLYHNDQIRPELKNPNPKSDHKANYRQKCPPLKLYSSDAICPSNHDRSWDKERGIECDLTLRLGCVVVPCASVENSRSLQMDGSDLEGRKFKSRLHK